MTFKIGDKVMITERGFDVGYYDSRLKNVVGVVTRKMDELEHDAFAMDFPEFSDYGVYERHLELATVTDWRARIEGKK